MSSQVEEFFAAAQGVADERYAGDLNVGFAHLGLQLAYPTLDLTDEQAEDITSVDRAGDLGVDGVYTDAEEQIVYLFQSKSSRSLRDDELHRDIAAFLDAPTKLQSDEWVAKAHSEMRDIANEFRESVRSGFELVFAFVTGSPVSKTVRSTFQDLSQAPGTRIAAKLVLLGEAELGDRYQKLLLSLYGRPTTVQFSADRSQMHEPASAERVMYLTIPAHEYIAACKSYGMELFRYNPRLYLGTNRVNQGIASTLRNKGDRQYFHLLNNGITAVCERFEAVDAGGSQVVVQVEDFQVVNGCQTTMTLFANSAEVAADDSCLVDLKLIEAKNLRDLVSHTTNTQTSILAEDAFSNAEEQKRIHNELRRYGPPYFYGHKRGAWDRLKAHERRNFLQEDRRYRKLTSKELAAVCLAIFGEPESAKDKPRIAFEKVGGKNSTYYERIFMPTNSAAQWLLPFELLRCSTSLVKQCASQAKQECPDDPDCRVAVRARIGAYGRFRMVNVAYGYLRQTAGTEADFVGALASNSLLQSMSTWAEPLMQVAFDAIVDSYEDAQSRGESSGLREFFREKKHQKLVQDRFASELTRNERLAQRERKTLAQFLGIPAK